MKASLRFIGLISVTVMTFAGALSVSSVEASRYWEEARCFSLVGQSSLDGGFDVNGNNRCDDREVLIGLVDLPAAITHHMLRAERYSLCSVVTRTGAPAAFLGYAESGEFRGLFQNFDELPLDGTVFPGGLNGDGDCNDHESFRENFTELTYFALGDSVASGHGLMDDGSTCRRSFQAYPYLVAEILRQNFNVVHFPDSHHLACSGATAGGQDGERSLQYQVDSVLEQLDETPTLVSFTIGANDFEWSDPTNFSYHLYWQSGGDYRDWTDGVASRVESNLSIAVNRLLEHDNVSIVLTEYHNPFNSDSVFFLSPAPGLCAFRDCFGRTEQGVDALNTVLESVVKSESSSRVAITSGLNNAFALHQSPSPSCGNDGPDVSETWVQYRTDPDSNSYPGIANWFGDRFGDWKGDCFHPNFAGAKQFAMFTFDAVLGLQILQTR